MAPTSFVRTVIVALTLGMASAAHAQTTDRRFSVDLGVGWDNSFSGNINSSTIGSINNQTVVILKNKYEDVYGTGFHLRVGGGYMLNESTEARVTYSFQSIDADLATLGDYGASPLYAQYSDYKASSLDFGLRRYARINTNLRPYGEGSIGIGFVNQIDAELVAPQANLRIDSTDFYDDTTTFTLGVHAGLLWALSDQLGAFAQLGIRYVTGMSDVDNLVGTGLDPINDDSQRWAMPFLIGVRVGF
jgi:hypothetical protein